MGILCSRLEPPPLGRNISVSPLGSELGFAPVLLTDDFAPVLSEGDTIIWEIPQHIEEGLYAVHVTSVYEKTGISSQRADT